MNCMELKNVNKAFELNGKNLHILKNIDISFEKGKFYAIMGRSGAGKTTLINILGLLDDPTSGDYYFNNQNVRNLSANEKAKIRGLEIGFVFQSFYLNNNLTAIENVILPTLINNQLTKQQRKNLAISLLNKLGLSDRVNHKPKELSGGEQQRVAIARALINNPKVVIADEPTGNLDSESEKEVFSILKNISENGKTVIVVTHNELIKNYCDVLYEINDGVIKRSKK